MVEKEFSKISIIEERVELMIDPTTSEAEQNPTKRTAHFLKPSLNLNSSPPKLPKIQSFSSSSPKPNVVFLCHSTPLKGWQTWVEKLQATHEPVWRKAGIFDAIKGSTCHITKVNDLIFSLVEKWCPETNTFVFPWGEATVTLEDVLILGGFSPLGVDVSVSSDSSSLEKNVERVVNNLIYLYDIIKDKHNQLSQVRWQDHFMGCGYEIEYAGFLALWLARHVFPGRNNYLVGQKVFAMAAMISCGAKLAFGPVILASIYRDLTLLKREIVGPLKLSSQLQLVQVWAWERFPSLGPVPRMMNGGGIRLARWECCVRKLIDIPDDIEMCLDSGRETFRWRPYCMFIENLSLPMFYVNSGTTWVIVDSDEEEEWKLVFGRCLMVGQLSGLDCVQNYNPHRVALQFGFDQDIPESVDISNLGNSLMNFKGLKLYIPPRLQEGDITYRYFDWWRTRFDVQRVVLVGCKRKNTSDKRLQKMAKTFDRSSEEDLGKTDDVGRERNQERDLIKHDMKMENSSEYLEANVVHIRTPTECNGSLTRVACEALSEDPNTNYSKTQEVAVSLQVMDNCVHNPFAALFLEYESRISRLERYFNSALLVSNPT
ncbi:uncharacterized protein LOC141591271 [Silene latifolia]|uniref:uncharacterized protein LOC141591271 n=1 Tax=Silene latifolia TaxID=37657 RepID=UPI003D773999